MYCLLSRPYPPYGWHSRARILFIVGLCNLNRNVVLSLPLLPLLPLSLVLLTGELLERCSSAANRINGQLWLSFRERAGSCVPVRAGRRHVGAAAGRLGAGGEHVHLTPRSPLTPPQSPLKSRRLDSSVFPIPPLFHPAAPMSDRSNHPRACIPQFERLLR